MASRIPYACRGMVWSQGEANASNPEEYSLSLPAWVGRLREGWGREALHFLAVMLPGFGVEKGHPDMNSWAWFREAQMEVLGFPDAAVVNTIDLGHAKTFHPSDKEPSAGACLCWRGRPSMARAFPGRGLATRVPPTSAGNASLM